MPLRLIIGWSYREGEGPQCHCFCREKRGRGSTNEKERQQRRINELRTSFSIGMPAYLLSLDIVSATSRQKLQLRCVS